jgi:prepilin-type N-terminal cleavage/methylation domain-containing protein
MKKVSKGFTLIELLVVIAIIGILSSVVLASLNTARSKGANAAVKSNLANLRAQMEIYFDNPTLGNNTYGATGANAINCVGANAATIFGNAKVQSSLAAAASAGGGVARCVAQPTTNSSSYVVSVQLRTPEGSNNFWCIDSSGASKGHATGIAIGNTATVCP